MPWYDVWEKRRIYLTESDGGPGGGGGGVPGVPTHPIAGPPGEQPPYYPSHPWVPPGGQPSHPWVPPGGQPSHPWIPPSPGQPTHPWVPPSGGQPSHPWVPPTGPEHPIVLPPTSPTGPMVYRPLPEGYAPIAEPPEGPPDMESPGYWAVVFRDAGAGAKGVGPGPGEACFIQSALIVDDGHEPIPPVRGLPGEWLGVYATEHPHSALAWIPTVDPGSIPHPEPRRT